jgi:amino acid transporter
MAATVDTAQVPTTRRIGLRREIGFIGLLWASGGSIIGSGWLFGAQGAVATAGPAAIISWTIGAVAILLLALVHAELGGMYPVAGGTARFPHYAFGGAAGASFGWFSWLQAVTVPPIEVMAMIQYGQHYSFASGWMKMSHGQHVLTGTGVAVAIGLMAALTALNFLSVRRLAHTNSTATWWKVGIPLLTIAVLALTSFHPHNFTAADGFSPYGAAGVLAAVSTSGIIFALLGFEQADQLAGESANPKRGIPRAVIGAIAIGAVIDILLQSLPDRAAGVADRRRRRSAARGRTADSPASAARSRSWPRSSAWGGWPRSSTSTPSSHRAGRGSSTSPERRGSPMA